MKWIGQNIYDQVSRFRNDVHISSGKSFYLEGTLYGSGSGANTLPIVAGDITVYNAVNDGNPTISLGSSITERLEIKAQYESGAQGLDGAMFKTYTAGSSTNDGRFTFFVDEVGTFQIRDHGINLYAGKSLQMGNVDILTNDGSGSTTLNNIAALDATTEETIKAAIDTLSNLTAASSLATVGTIGTGVWQGTAIASAYLDSDTAHLSGEQTFLGEKTFVRTVRLDGDRSTLGDGDGAAIHVDLHEVTDGTTSASGTAAMFTHVNIEAPRLLATNSSVTTTSAASLYIKNAPAAGTNQTITNAYALWVDDGLVKFDGALTVGGTITGDVTGDLTGQAATVATIAGLAPNTATTQATQGNITSCANLATVGTIGTGVWQGDPIASAYIADDAVTFAKAQGVTPNVFDNKIKLIPSDFMANDDGGNQKFGVGYVETAGSGYGMRTANNSTELYAFVSIPQGMTATHVDIFDKNDLAIEVFEAQINATTMVSKGSGNANTTLDITDVASTATNFLVIEVATTSATGDKVYGGTVTIA